MYRTVIDVRTGQTTHVPLTEVEQEILETQAKSFFLENFIKQLSDYREDRINTVLEIEIPEGPEFLLAGKVVFLRNNDKTRCAVKEKIQDLKDDEGLSSLSFKTINPDKIGDKENEEAIWLDIGQNDFSFIRKTLSNYVQKCFEATRFVEEKHYQNPYTDDQWKEDFDTVLSA